MRQGPGRGMQGAAWAVLLFLLLPMAVVLPVSLTDRRYLSLPQDGLSLQHYANLLHSADWQSSIGQSLLVATLSMAGATVLGTLCAIGCWQAGTRWAKVVGALMLVPIVVPTIVYALGLYRFYARLGLLDTLTGVVLAHTVTGIPYVVVIVSAALAGLDARLVPAARSLGAGVGQVLGCCRCCGPRCCRGRCSRLCIAGTSWCWCCSWRGAGCSRCRGACGTGSTTSWTRRWRRWRCCWWS